MKKCSKCDIEKQDTEFFKRKKSLDGLAAMCKDCSREYQKEYKKENKKKLQERDKKYSFRNKEKIKKYQDEYRKNHREEAKEYQKEYYKKNKERYNEQKRDRYKNDIDFKIRLLVRSRVYKSVKRRSNSSMDYLGCDIDFYKSYLEGLFQEGMSWENYGEWHIDHIKPIISFDLSKEENIFDAFHYSNTQPLWAEANLSKGGKQPEGLFKT